MELTPAAAEHRERRQRHLRRYANEGMHEAHLGDAGVDLERLETGKGDGNVVEEEGVPAAELDGAGPIRVS